MSQAPTSWIWADQANGGVKGARLEADTGMIEWVSQPGCGCGDATKRQSFSDFRANGPCESPPEDVLVEMRHALSIDSLVTRC